MVNPCCCDTGLRVNTERKNGYHELACFLGLMALAFICFLAGVIGFIFFYDKAICLGL